MGSKEIEIHNVRLSENELSKRGSQLSGLLRPLINSNHKGYLSWNKKITSNGLLIVARDFETGYDFKQWRFSTYHPKFRALYYENWMPENLQKPNNWYLLKAYLNIYLVNKRPPSEQEYIFLHTDPENNSNGNRKYKQSPHLHIKIAEPPFKKAHLALSHGYIKHIFEKRQIFEAMSYGIEMIRDEILDRIPFN